MNELSNSVTMVGNYNNILTSITSNTLVVSIIEELTITRKVDKQNWIDGFLTYIITINNKNNTTFFNSIVTDIIDTSLVNFMANSITINGRPASKREYSYDGDSNILRITLAEVVANTDTIITYRIKKRYNTEFYLKNSSMLTYDNKTIYSNMVTVRSYMVTPRKFSFDCKSPFWRY